MKTGWHFTDDIGGFSLDNPELSSYLYFPLANEAGMMSSVTPTLGGDCKTSQNTFVLAPVSAEELHASRATRNFWLAIDGIGNWSATGVSAAQRAELFAADKEKTRLDAGILWHTMTRENDVLGLCATITSFVPTEQEQVELSRVTIKNTGSNPLTFTPYSAVPLYGRSADNCRDHKHVTSLLHRATVTAYGISLTPTLTFDERGHRKGVVSYGAFAADEKGAAPVAFCPVVEDFIGEGGSFDNPQAVGTAFTAHAGDTAEGYEMIGAAQFAPVTLQPGKTVSFVTALAVQQQNSDFSALCAKYLRADAFEAYRQKAETYWADKLNLNFRSGDRDFDRWMRWVSFQPILRRIYGCSFLPHHDYGRGGRGWRDLWQDCLALLLMEPDEVRSLLLNNFAGVRFDGTNATIIGVEPGEFVADRNAITRVWMDHAAWPLVTTKLYIDQTADIDFLLEQQKYFKDMQTFRGTKKDTAWNAADGCWLRTENGAEYSGTVLEHLLIQNLTAFFNVGEHNIMKLDGADWNDGLDMAAQRGESVAFTCLYHSNLRDLADLIDTLAARHGSDELTLSGALADLLDTLGGKAAYESVSYKTDLLNRYYAHSASRVDSTQRSFSAKAVAADLRSKADWLRAHLQQQEWVTSKDGEGWFNSYYDNSGNRVEGDFDSGVRMMLTGQVFAVMGHVATEEQTASIIKAADRYLYDKRIGGYRLNTNFHELKTDLGRLFGFAYGHKENGAVFSHMTIMYANALYRRRFAKEGYKALQSLYETCADFETGRVYPGVPEYMNERGRGMYHYLTGSASWAILTLLTCVYGVRGENGTLTLDPQLLACQFDEHDKATVSSLYQNKMLTVTYYNPSKKDAGDYTVTAVLLNGQPVVFKRTGNGVCLDKAMVDALDTASAHTLTVTLG